MKKEVITSNLKYFRANLGLKQTEVSEELGMDRSGYGKIENGHTDLTLERAQQLAKIYGVTVQQLLEPRDPAAREPMIANEPARTYRPQRASIKIEIGVNCGNNTPEAERFLKRLGALLMDSDVNPDPDDAEPGQ